MSAIYDKGRQAFLNKDIDMIDDNIKCVLVDTGAYSVDLAAHDMHNDLLGIIATSANLGTKTTTAGVFDAADVTFSSVTGATVEAIVIYRDSGTSSTSQLIAYIDSGTGLPVTPNGGDITIAWDNGANKIFKI